MKKKDINSAKRYFKEWHDTHPDEYAKFLEQVNDALEKGDIALFENNFHLLERALPSKVFEYFNTPENNPFNCLGTEGFQFGKLIDSSMRIMKDVTEFVPDFMINFKEQSYDTKNPQLLSMYYWAFFEGGSIKMKELFSKYFGLNDSPDLKGFEFENLMELLIPNSIQNFMDTKKDWKNDNQQDTDPIMKEAVATVLKDVKGVNAGRNDTDKDLEQLLIGNIERLMDEVEYFVSHRGPDSNLAYILYFLRMAECVEECDYTTFHRAVIRRFPDANIKGFDRAQSLYGTLTNRKDKIGPRHQKKLEELKKKMFVKFVEAK